MINMICDKDDHMITEEREREWQSLTSGPVGFLNTLVPESRERDRLTC